MASLIKINSLIIKITKIIKIKEWQNNTIPDNGKIGESVLTQKAAADIFIILSLFLSKFFSDEVKYLLKYLTENSRWLRWKFLI